MPKRWRIAQLLLCTAIVSPQAALAQDAPSQPPTSPSTTVAPEDEVAATDPAAEQEIPPAPEVSVPGGAGDTIVVRGRRTNVQRNSAQVVNVLSTEAIAKTGSGDIAGALQRVTGLSVVGNGFVYVRGLGDRYSLALLNGSPLPSPEPLKRSIPLDLFPTNVIASSLVQKSYSVNFPGEFGGGVINLTTKSIPDQPFLTVGGSVGYDSEVTGELGYTYYGSKSDWTGFDNGARDIPPALQAYFDSGERISGGLVDTTPIASQLVSPRNALLQRNDDMPVNWGANITGGTAFDMGSTRLGVIATGGYSTKFRTRDTLQQRASSADLSQLATDFQRVITDNRIVINGLLGLGLEFDVNKVRWTNLYIRDTLKQARLGAGEKPNGNPGASFMQQDTAWFERQVISSQLAGEFKLTDALSLDLRGGYANSQREAPEELSLEYYRSNAAADPFGALFINRLNNGQQGSATTQYSDLNEDLWSGGADLTYRFSPSVKATVGYAYGNTKRLTEVRSFQFTAPSDFPLGVATLRPDLLLQPAVIDYFDIDLIDTSESNPVFLAKLRNHAGYGQLTLQLTDAINVVGGVRYETAKQTVNAVNVFNDEISSNVSTNLDDNYWLPAATITYQATPQLQFRVSASKTIARPQFRELVFQPYTDPDNNRVYTGNPLLVDSTLKNAEARAEYYFRGEQRVAIAGFYKAIDNPIETFASSGDNSISASFANAPSATLWGIELEALKHFGMGDMLGGPRRLVVSGNYTFSKSRLKVGQGDLAPLLGAPDNLATDLFDDGEPLTGQAKHIANIEIGFEHEGRLSQQTLLLNYASKRVTNRGADQPDIYEQPGLRVDFVAREGIKLFKREIELKFEARNLTRRRYEEFQDNGDNKVFYNRYRIGTTFSLGAAVKF